MDKFRILFHGQFSNPRTEDTEEGRKVSDDVPYEGFYTSRLVAASSLDAAIGRGREMIREELDETLLHGRQSELISLEAEEWEVATGFDSSPNTGFTFY